jgi:transposase InsO family protein
MKGKQTVARFPARSQTKTSRVLEPAHTDLMGPMKTKSTGGAKYVVIFVDDYSSYVVVYFLKKKSEVAARFREFKSLYQNQWGEHIKVIRSDNGTEFVKNAFDGICQASGIVHQRTVPISLHQNDVAERMNRTLMKKARSMIHYKSVVL